LISSAEDRQFTAEHAEIAEIAEKNYRITAIVLLLPNSDLQIRAGWFGGACGRFAVVQHIRDAVPETHDR